MIFGILCGQEQKLLTAIGQTLQACVQRRSGEECRFLLCQDIVALRQVTRSREVWDVACVDIADGSAMELATEIRKACSAVELLLVVNPDVSPMEYVRPGIMPSGLVQRGARTDSVQRAIDDFVAYALRGRHGYQDESCFVMETKEGALRIPYSSIVCFESRAKRISVRLRRDEYIYYDTLERLEHTLPSNFVRCHRSYIVNMSRVVELQLSSAQIRMDDDSYIPVSRSYKSSIRERFA